MTRPGRPGRVASHRIEHRMIHARTRTTLLVCSVALILAYFFPIWKITLEAPQYPEGLGMYIWIDTITGVGEHDLQNINGLNHYIGMKTIEPESIAELRIMPWLVAFLIVFGLIAGGSRRPGLMYAWIALFAVVAIVGLVDFYMWEYDYGHNLNPTAAIRIPGMSYQPPLIGSKKLLNFTAHSYPALGGLIIFLSPVLALGAAVKDWLHATQVGKA